VKGTWFKVKGLKFKIVANSWFDYAHHPHLITYDSPLTLKKFKV